VQESVLTLEEGVELQRMALKNGNYFVLGPVTIATLKHAVLCEQDERMIQRIGKKLVSPRINVVLQQNKTKLSRLHCALPLVVRVIGPVLVSN
jgi:hypothetical protein